MATTVAVLEAKLRADTRDFDRGMDKSSGTMRKVGNAAGIAGAAIAGGLAVAAKIGFDEFKEGQKVTAQTNAVLKSTKGIANVTSKEIDRLGTSIMRKTGIDDEAVKSSANLLLTFTKVRNETGKGNDIFNQATHTVQDMSVALGQDASKSAIQLGKALNDPVKGASALRRVGVQLTEAQEDQIKTLVQGQTTWEAFASVLGDKVTPAQFQQLKDLKDTDMSMAKLAATIGLNVTPAQVKMLESLTEGGKTMAAQKIILQELQTEFGGSAVAAGQTFAGQVNILKESFANLMGEIVAGLMPTLLTLSRHMLTAVDYLQRNERKAKILMFALAGLATALIAAKVAQILLNLAVLANPYVAAAAAIVLLTVALVILWQKYENLRILIIAFVARFTPLGAAILLVKNHFGLLETALNKVQASFAWIRDFAGPAVQTAWDIAKAPLRAIEKNFDDIRKVVRAIINALKWIKENIGGILGGVADVVGGAAGAVGGALGSLNPRGEGGPAGPGGPIGGGRGGQLPLGLTQAANWIDARGFPYVWGGGHSPSTYNGPYDCSGAVSALLRAGGLMRGSMVSGQFMSYGDPGPGRALSILANPEHVYAIINGRAWGTSGQNPGGGAGWFSGGPRAGFTVRHPPGFDRGGVVPGFGPKLVLAHGGETILPTHRGSAQTVNFNFPNYVGSKQELMGWLQNAAQEFKRRNGRGLM